MAKRTKLADRILPNYSQKEEIFNTISHAVGAVCGVIILVLCIVFSCKSGDVWKIITTAFYGLSFTVLYAVSSIYHGLKNVTAKKVMQVIDHCTIYFLIAGTYTPILLCNVREVLPVAAWGLFALLWCCLALAVTLTAIDLKKYSKLSMLCYVVMGWSALLVLETVIQAITIAGFLYVLIGGIVYTIGAVLYALGKKRTVMHCVFHVFCLVGSIFQFFGIFFYVVL